MTERIFSIIVGMIRYQENCSLLPFNTFSIDVSARHLFHLERTDQLPEIFDYPGFREMSYNMNKLLVLGGGSNLLFTDDYQGVVIRNETGGIKVIDEDELSVTLEAGAGVIWDDLVEYSVSRGWGGIENLVLIPGTVGAAPVQNIGAYGAEAADVIVRVNGYNYRKGEWTVMSNSNCEFGYRDSIFKRQLRKSIVITSVIFRLSKSPRLVLEYGEVKRAVAAGGITPSTVRDMSEIISAIRRSKLPDPALVPNGGSFFKNPVISATAFQALQGAHPQVKYHCQGDQYKISAAWLIEQAGWKGRREGDAGCYGKQALIIVNHGRATGREILAFSERITESVFTMFGVELVREVNLAV